MNTKAKYLKDEQGNVFSPITSVETVYKGTTKLIDLFYPVGSYYETSDKNFNPNKSWGGTWKKDTVGLTTVGCVDSATATDTYGVNLTVGTKAGSKTHTMKWAEMVKHGHSAAAINPSTASGAYTASAWGFDYNARAGDTDPVVRRVINFGATSQDTTTGWVSAIDSNYAGNSEPFNIMQPSIGVYRWHRTA